MMSTGRESRSRTDPSLLRAVRDPWDHQAWAEFERRYGPMIEGWCRRWFPRETEDRVQDVYFKLVARLKTFEYDPARGRFRGWLKTLTNRLMRDLKRSARVDHFVDDSFLEQAEAGQDLYERLAAKYDLELLEMAKEDVRHRVAKRTWLIYVEMAERGREAGDIARELGMAIGAVYVAKYRVQTALREYIQGHEDLP
jgi:RNA polymerase sigma-70 factor (ECF subfamily)